jgi:DNA-binding transcriptional MerR regulator
MSLSIGELSQKSRVKVPTIRYYERVGLIPTPERQDGERRYSTADAARLSFIRYARELGFETGEIRAVLEMTTTGNAEEIGIMVGHIDQRIGQLGKFRQELEDISVQIRAGALNEPAVLSTLGQLSGIAEASEPLDGEKEGVGETAGVSEPSDGVRRKKRKA